MTTIDDDEFPEAVFGIKQLPHGKWVATMTFVHNNAEIVGTEEFDSKEECALEMADRTIESGCDLKLDHQTHLDRMENDEEYREAVDRIQKLINRQNN